MIACVHWSSRVSVCACPYGWAAREATHRVPLCLWMGVLVWLLVACVCVYFRLWMGLIVWLLVACVCVCFRLWMGLLVWLLVACVTLLSVCAFACGRFG